MVRIPDALTPFSFYPQPTRLSASDEAANDEFGVSVAISGSTIVGGAPRDSIVDNLFQGSAYVFNRQGGGWVEVQKLAASDGARVTNSVGQSLSATRRSS